MQKQRAWACNFIRNKTPLKQFYCELVKELVFYRIPIVGSIRVFVKVFSPAFSRILLLIQLFHEGGLYHIETSPLICRASHLVSV